MNNFQSNNTGILEHFFSKLKKLTPDIRTHSCIFIDLFINTIYYLNNLFDFNVQVKLTAF